MISRPSDPNSWWNRNISRYTGEILFDEPLSRLTYYRIGGPASLVVTPKSREDLRWLSDGISATHIPFFILGKGSNVLASDQGYEGLIIRTHRLNLDIEFLGWDAQSQQGRIRVGASVAISSLLRKAAQEGWGGLEFLTGIPGSIGGAVKMNAGTHLGEVQSRLHSVEVYSLIQDDQKNQSALIFKNDQLQFQYRKNLFLKPGNLVFSTEWRVDQKEPSEVKILIDQTLQRRKSTQPIDFPSCGSVFKNPKSKISSAWEVLDQLGLRGYRIGDAQIAEKHSNFIINLGNAKASDVKALIDLAKARAQNELGIRLEEEVIYLG